MISAFPCYANYHSTVNKKGGKTKRIFFFENSAQIKKKLEMSFTFLVENVNSFHLICKTLF